MKSLVAFLCCFISIPVFAQELFVNSENASIIPARSLTGSLDVHLVGNDRLYARPAQRYVPAIKFGISNRLELRIGGTLSNMHTYQFRGESVSVYGKYRLMSREELHRHFRVAGFLSASFTNAPFHYDEATLHGGKSGMDLGIIATQLINKLALSATISHMQLFDKSRFNDVVYLPTRNFQLINYSFSTGYLLLPTSYRNFKQVNLNLYLELLGQRSLELRKQYLDLAPAIQLIFFSSLKISGSYRFQVEGSMDRMTHESWLISVEKSFLDIWASRVRKQKISH